MTRPRPTAVAPIAVGFVIAVALLAPGVASAARAPRELRAGGPVASGTPGSPTVTVSAAGAAVGTPVTVGLSGWPAGAVTVAVCGDGARRGSVDCDQIGSRGVGVPASGAVTTRLVVAPPVGCPCVVRVSTPSSDIVRVVPLEVVGVAVLSPSELGPELRAPVAPDSLRVEARLSDPPGGSGSFTGSFGGPVGRLLVLTVRNTGAVALAGVTVSGAVGRGHGDGAPVAVPPIGTLGPGEVRTVTAPVTIPAFAVGDYVVFGRVDSMGGAASFATGTDNRPWGALAAVVAGVVVLVVRAARRRSGRFRGPGRAARRRAPVDELPVVADRAVEQPPEPVHQPELVP